MSNLHYTKSGALDMRYSSSRAAVASDYSSSSSSSYSAPSSSNFGNSSASGGGLHYAKSGALDMRYNSSRAAVAATQSSSAARASSSSSYAAPSSSELHYTKSGALDMRYSSSRAAVAQASAATPPPAPTWSGQLHLKKDQTPDMRYKSSHEFVKRMENLELNTSSKKEASAAKTKTQPRVQGVARGVPVTKSGAPDLRTTRAKEWVQEQARNWHPAESLPPWVPCLKDGSPDMTKTIARHFIGGSPALLQTDKRDNYYENKCLRDRLFEQMMQEQRDMPVEMVREPVPVQATNQLRAAFADVVEKKEDGFMPASNVAQLDYEKDLVIAADAEPLGHGGFGTVYRGKWKGNNVAIKKLHASKLTKKDRKMFVRETLILGLLGDHPNVVQLHGYTLNPLSLVMEFVPKGSLSYLLHYCEDAEVEAKMTDGRVKLNILLGVAYGMIQLHACRVTHGDLKPQNVLITDEFHAKIADFGLATFRAKAASTTSSHMLSGSTGDDDTDADFEGIAGGTAAYMAPELLDPNAVANEKTDVYSFGVMMNEVLQEEEPYQQNLRQFVGKGPFASVLFAKAGNRPLIRDKKVTPALRRIIERCWIQQPADRPTFGEVAKLLTKCAVPHACG